MSAYKNPPRGYVYMVFELGADGLRFLACVPRSSTRGKVVVKAKVQPMRKTKGANRLVIYCVPVEPVVEAFRQFVEAFTTVFNGIASRITTALQPLVGMPINEAMREEAARILSSIPPAVSHINIEVTK